MLATLLVRRRDLLSVVRRAAAGLRRRRLRQHRAGTVGHFTLPTIATLLVRGFPTMAIATGAAFVLALFRLIARR